MSMSECIIDQTCLVLKAYLDQCATDREFEKAHLSGAGEIYLFEKKLADYYGKKYALTFSNATTAIHSLCIAYELTGKEIITAPFNWGGAIAPFLLYGNTIRFSSFEPETLSLLTKGLKANQTKKTQALLSVDFNGFPANSRQIKSFCREHGLAYISDSSQSLGAWRDGKPAGYFADVTVFSFSAGKTMFGGEGGAIVTDEEELYEKLLDVAHHPARQKRVCGFKNINEFPLLNGRMNPLAAIVLNACFYPALAELKNKQERFFSIARQLIKNDLIASHEGLASVDSATWFKTVFQLCEKVDSNDLFIAINNPGSTFVVEQNNALIPIPSNTTFLKKYKNQFSMSGMLKRQLTEFDSSRYITLKIVPEHSSQ